MESPTPLGPLLFGQFSLLKRPAARAAVAGWNKHRSCRSVARAAIEAGPVTMSMTDGETYPRDMIGYGRTPPYAGWPNNARVALQFVINYEEGGENNILHGDAASERSCPRSSAPRPGRACAT